MNEQRRTQRIELPKPLPITENLSQSFQGSLINLSKNGMMLSSQYTLEPEHIYQLDIQLSPEQSAIVGAECMWVKQMEGQYWAGLEIISISQTDRQRLMQGLK